MSPLSLLIVFIPILTAGAIAAGLPARRTALCSSIANLLIVMFTFAEFEPSWRRFQFTAELPLLREWGLSLSFGFDGLSIVMVLLAAVVTLAAVWFTGSIEKHERAFYACLLLISGATMGAFASLDLFFFYAFHELALVPTFLLIGIWGSGDRVAAAWKVTIYLALGSFVLLLGLILLYQSVPANLRSFDMRVLKTAAGQIAPDAQRHIYLLLLIGFGILISLFPFHSWAPQAYASAPAPAAMLHAGVLKKFGLYGLLRLAVPLLPAGSQYWVGLLMILLLGNIVYIGLVTIAQKRLDWMLGYSSVMHMGYIFLGIASANLLGTMGAASLMFAHGLSIALLFGIAGEIHKRTGTLDFADLGGLGKTMPLAGLAFGFAAFAAVGLPGFANFAAEIMVFFGAFRSGWEMARLHTLQIATILALWGVVISAVYMLRAYRNVFMGLPNERWNTLRDLRPGLRFPIAMLVALLLWFGFNPQQLVDTVAPAFRTYFVSAP
jgi:NADH-quinone oxidoreductase subunit M